MYLIDQKPHVTAVIFIFVNHAAAFVAQLLNVLHISLTFSREAQNIKKVIVQKRSEPSNVSQLLPIRKLIFAFEYQDLCCNKVVKI